MKPDKATLVAFIRQNRAGVVSTVSKNGAPEAALVYLAVTDDLELIFYALQNTRKSMNLRRDPRIAIVIGGDGDKSLQYEGIADEPYGRELARIKEVYADARPDARAQMQWPGLTYFRVKPAWIRMSDYGRAWSIEEMRF